ncbi:tape measure protein [Enterobacter hormaechei]|uniref:tape measure protein n=2 Tax=Enterobacter cloacae complex TaxID=354276 RepID=UPI00192D13AC|nr:tape measure protein [Enterobacter hormaechei]MBL6016878.1 tape measure protein [Enterobacter hormaechei]MBL6021901.1 tape measure protein [Enterobacter hormaechei]MBL6051856.1 tape measure protein [Enterobacter hormaechei]MBL6056869.1 tape measure protein [Enterobacter hormaechei]MBL6061880.1 tape measure protein [Enterobacter hormaechei]
MAGTVSAGTIVYEVDMDTAGILQGRRDIDAALNGLNGSMGRLEAGLNRTERSLSSIEGTMSSLTGVAKALIAALSVQQVGAYAQAWQDLSNKLANAVRDSVPPFETLADVTERVFDISQKTRSGLDATATLYARLERSTRSYGVSVEDITKLTTIINQGFVVSGATAEEASNAIIQLAQGLASGALRGDEFNSVNEQGNRLMIALADSMNVSIGALRNMAAEGKLTTDVIVNGLLSQGDKIGQEFAKTTATISQSLEIANNNITKFFGENATVKTGVKIFSDSVISLSENLDVLSTTLTIVAGVMGARYVGALTMATSAKIADIAASRQQVVADNQTAQAALVAANSVQRKALADKEAALSSLALAQAEYNVAKGSAAEMLAMDALVAAKTRATTASLALAEAETAQAAASARAATAARAASVGIGMARGALALIGGPAGAAMLAAGAIFYFWQKAQQAKEEAIAFADGLDKLNAAMNAMSNTQLRGAIADANNSIRAQKEAVADLQSEVDSLRDRYQNFTPAAQKVAESMGQGADFARQQAEVSDELARKTRDLEAAKDKLSRTEETASEATRTLTNNMLTAMGVHDQLIEKSWSLEQVQGAVAKAFGETADEINRANQAGKSFDPKALQISPATKDGDKVIATLEEQNELLKIQDERDRAIAKARMQAAKVTDNQNQISAAGRLAAENYDLEKSEEARKKAQQESEQQGKKSASSAESVAQKLANLKQQAELAAGSTQELSREQAILRAQQSLGSAATQAQIKEAGEYAAKAWDAAAAARGVTEALKAMPLQAENKSYAESMQNLKAALNAGKIDLKEYNVATEKMALEHQNNLAKINAQATVNPVASARAEVDPVQQLVNENNQKLALMQQYQQQEQAILQQSYQKGKINYDQFVAAKAATDAQYLALKTAQENQFNEQMTAAQWQLLSQQGLGYEMLTSAVDAFSGNASNALTGLITGTMSAQDAMRSLGNTMLNSVVNALVQVGVEALKNFIIGQTLGAAATAAGASQAAILATAWAPAAAMASLASFGANSVPAMTGIASTVGLAQGLALTGMRYNGGPVNAGGLYQVGERGKPEIYQASTGKQYMIPGDNGRVISNKDMTSGGGGGAPILNIYNYSSASVDAQATQNGDGSWTLEAFIADMNNGGPASNAITSNMNVKRTPRGQG